MAASTIFNRFGKNADVDGLEDIWDGGGTYTGFPVSDVEKFEVLSSSAADTAAGTGARTIRIFGLDADYVAQQEDVILNGTTPVDTVGTYRRLTRAYILTAGSGTTNAGAITIRHTTTTANVFCVITAGIGQTQLTSYTVPAGKTAYLKNYTVSLEDATANAAQMAFWYRENGGAVRIVREFVASTQFQFSRSILGGMAIPEKTDFIMRALAVANTNAIITAAYDLEIVDNN